MERDREVRMAVGSTMSGNLLGSEDHSINRNRGDYWTEDVVAGCRRDGRMSVVRRFFCLFVTFDLLFTILTWLICIMLIGEDISSALAEQVVHYSIRTSLFDIVMAAAARFTVLIMFYALLYINHWIIVAITTSGTCAFLIAKVFVYVWVDAKEPAFQVLLILISFVLAWGEAWFMDFRVLPQESHAQQFQSGPNIPTERDLFRNHYNSSASRRQSFYSPLESPNDSNDEGDGGHVNVHSHRELTPQEEEYKKKGLEALRDAWRLVNSDGWILEKRRSGEESDGGSECDEVHSMHLLGSPNEKKIYKLKGRVKLPAKFLLNELFFRIDHVPDWNPTLLKCHRIQAVDDHTDISYQVTAKAAGGLVTSRDFVNLRHWDIVDGSYVSAGLSITHPDKPPQEGYVRGENGPGCWAMTPIPGDPGSCTFQWLLDTDLKGWLQKGVVDRALIGAMFDYIRHIRQYAKKLNSSKGQLLGILPTECQNDDEQMLLANDHLCNP